MMPAKHHRAVLFLVGVYHPGMDSTLLDLLTRDGKCSITFFPALDQSHYAQLLEVSQACASASELRVAIQLAAKAWLREVEFD